MTQDTSTEAWEALMNYEQADMDGITVLVSRQAIHECKDDRDTLQERLDQALARERALLDSNQEARDFIRERDTLAKQAEDCARTCAERAEEIQTLTGQLAEARGTLDRIDVIAEVADAAPLCMGEIRELIKMNRALKTEPAPRQTFQSRVQPWMHACFGEEISGDRLERGDRLLEEVLELLQSGDYPPERVAALTEYTYSRPKGEPKQEVGGVMVTLAAYCLAHNLDMHEAGEAELARVWTKVEKIRAKQAAKPTGSALPQAFAAPRQSVQEAARVLLNAPRSTTGPMAYAGRVAEEFLEDVECGGEITTEIIEAFLSALAQGAQDDA